MAVGQAEQHRRVKISRVGRRILAHEDRIKGLQRILRALVEKFVVRISAPRQLASPRPRDDLRAARVEVAEAEKINFMAAKLRLEHEHESRVLVDQHPLERIHDERELARHRLISFRHLRLSFAHRQVTPPLC